MKVLDCPVDKAEALDLDAEIRRWTPKLLALIRARMDRVLAAHTKPEDILQDALVKAVEYWAEQPPSSPSVIYPWLRQKAMDCLVDRHRSIHAEIRDAQRDQPLPGGSSDQGGSQLAGSTSTPSVKLQHKEMEDRLLHALTQLKPADANILRMYYLDWRGRGLEEIAKEMGLTHGYARKLHGRAVRRLKNLWKALYGEEDFQL